jgi:cell division protease FtsH
MVKQSYKTVFLWVLLILGFFTVYQVVMSSSNRARELAFSDFEEAVDRGCVPSLTVKGRSFNFVKVDVNDDTRRPPAAGEAAGARDQCKRGLSKTTVERFGKRYTVVGYEPDRELNERLRQAGVRVTYEESERNSVWTSLLITWLPMLLLVGVFIFFMRQLQAGGGKAMSFGKSKAKLLSNQQNKVTFDDVAGIEEAQEELEEIIEFLRDPKKFQRLGGRIPKGVLLTGPPGTGKTLLARAIAGEAGVPFFSISGSDFVEMFVGVGASRVRDLFEQGKKNAPCIIFVDEIDAVGRHRGAGLGGGHDEREQTLNQLLVEMDGFETNDGVIIIAATNRPDVLDPALLRPGRFDRRIVVPRPDVRGREEILSVHTRRVPLGEDVGLGVIARGTPGFVGADLENLVNEAALLAARRNKTSVAMIDFEDAKDKVLMGTERRTMIISDEEKRVTAYHESGHTLVAKLLPNTDPVHKVTIIPRGPTMGVTQLLPEKDRLNYTKGWAENQICVALGGRIAEELVLGEVTNGATRDIKTATELSRAMVCEWGMSDRIGPLSLGKKEEAIFLGREIAQHQDYSEQTAIEIDREIRRFVIDAYNKARQIIEENLDKLHALANALLEHEVLDGYQIDQVLEGKPVKSKVGAQADPAHVDRAAKDKETEAQHGAPIFSTPPWEVPNES